MKNTKRITFNLFKKANGKLNVSILEGKASKHDKSFNVATGSTLTEMRKNAGIKDGAEWQITSRFDKRHVQPTMADGETVETFIRASKGDEVYYVAIIKGAKGGFRAVMHHKSKRNEYGVEIAETAKRFRTAETDCDVKNVSGTVNKPNGASFYNDSIQITSSFFCKKAAKKEETVVVEEVKEVVAVEVVETAKEKALKEELAAAYAKIEKLEAELAKKEEVKEIASEEVVVVEEKTVEEELEEVLNYRWGNVEEVADKEEEKEEKVVEIKEEKEEEEVKPAFDYVAARTAFLKNNRVTWDFEETKEDTVEFNVSEDEIRQNYEILHDGMYGTNYSAFAYAA
ncbi:hypothetical protein GT257_000579 [Salmonella enterica]|nr:hypothetical protein [Salmonella enterica]ECP1676496.1 hypothetical protein [Salmonella enterica]EDX2637009.1 hypothetical protein [Salmonella enterica]EEG0686627.1 hypothetical protein [Salmonella enterica]EEI4105248.1 hypothetical protein [Salmonella enterica]